VLEECKNCLSITRAIIKFKALGGVMSLKVLLQGFEASDGWD
jgi:hypothetical protein